MKKNKVLISYHYFPHYRLPIFKKLVNSNDYEYRFLSGQETDISIRLISQADMLENNINWIKVKNYWFYKKKFLWQEKIISECVFGDYDAVIFIANPYIISTLIAIIAAKFFKKKVLLWGHGTFRNKKRDFFKKMFYLLADGVMLYGNWARNNMIKLGFEPNKLFVIYNSLDYENQINKRKQLDYKKIQKEKETLFKNSELPLLLFIGRLTFRKELNKLISIIKKFKESGYPVNLLIVGDGESRINLENETATQKTKTFVHFYGETYDETTISHLIAMADICVSPGDVGLTAMHSMTYGTPVITHDNPYMQMPEFEAIIPGKTGDFYQYGSQQDLYDKIKNWLEKAKDQREEIRQNCFTIIDNFYNPLSQKLAIEQALDSLFRTEPCDD